jgi:hypothetical protein
MPTQTDLPGPAALAESLLGRKIIATIFADAEQKRWQGLFRKFLEQE